MWPTRSPSAVFRARRARLASALGPQAAVLCSGRPRVKNFPANTHPFRADSHFLYLVGRSIPDAALLLADPEPTLFAQPPDPDAALWHGPAPGLDELGASLGIKVRPLLELEDRLRSIKEEVATLSPNDDATAAWLSPLVRKRVKARQGALLREGSADAGLAEALIALRLVHDAAAVSQMRQSIAATATAHRAGMRATRQGIREAEIAAAMLAAMMGAGMRPSYEPIVTVHGEVLHAETYDNVIGPSDLILADVGAETPEGWAADVTRVWPASGRFSITQRALYQVVLQAQLAAIALVRPNARYRDIHETAARHIIAGLVDLGIFRGEVDGLFERGAHALFFPHGVGHLLGVDVHDMEDLGDRAGYQAGRTRPTRFGDRYLRLDRDLVPGMAVTIEPGFYQVPAILNDRELTAPFEKDFDRDELVHFSDVRGIRIEDDVLVTSGEPEVLSAAIPKEMRDIEAVFGFR
jgi:Xaa-Pro aminopeptidase